MTTRFRRLAPCLALLLAGAAGSAFAQLAPPEPGPPILTVLTNPPDVSLSITGPGEVYGRTPMDLPSSVVGRFSVIATGPGVARTQGVFFFPERGLAPSLLSEPPGLSPGLLVRALNYPGFGSISAKREARGLVMAAAATGGLTAGLLSHISYRDRLNETSAFSALRVREERRVRNAWAIYAGSVWALSAVDYMIRPRFGLREAAPTRMTISVPTASRGAVAWRSLLVPGAGQEYGNHRTRGTLWLLGELAAGAGYVLAEASVQDAKTDLEWRETIGDFAGAARERTDLESAENVRSGFAVGIVAVHAANFVDALVMSLGPPAAGPPPRVSAAFPVTPNGPSFALTYRY